MHADFIGTLDENPPLEDTDLVLPSLYQSAIIKCIDLKILWNDNSQKELCCYEA